MQRGILSESILTRRATAATTIRMTPIWQKMKDVKVWLLIGATGEEKTVSLDPLEWDVKIFSYKKSSKHGSYITLIGVEDSLVKAEADDWKDVIICMRKSIEEQLLLEVFYLMHYPGNKCKVSYKDELIYDSEVDDWRKTITLPW